MFGRKYWIPLSVLLIAIVAVGLYILQTRPPKAPILIVKPVEFEKQQPQPTAKALMGDTSQGGHFHADGTWHGETHDELTSDERFESDAEFKARMKKYNAEMAAAKTAREQNEALMRHMKASPYFDLHYQNVYNFYKAHPDYDHAKHETNSPELKQKYADAVYADVAKVRAENAARKAEYERNRYKGVDKSPWIPPQGGNR